MSFFIHEQYGYVSDIPQDLVDECISIEDTDEEGVQDLFIDIETLAEYAIINSTDIEYLDHLLTLAASRIGVLRAERDNSNRSSEWSVLGDK